MSRFKTRVSSKAPRELQDQLNKNQQRCAPHAGHIVRAANRYQPGGPFPELLREYGITPATVDTDELLLLCQEWENTPDDTDFFNIPQKGGRLEQLFRERCEQLRDLHNVDVDMELHRIMKRRDDI